MTALATSDDVEAALGRTLTDSETAKLAAALDGASAVVRTATGRFFEEGTFIVRRLARMGRVTLDDPESVSSVSRIDCGGTATAITGFMLRGGILFGVGCDGWVEVEYDTSGTIPAPIISVVAAMAGRSITSAIPVNAESYTITRGPFSESASFGTAMDAASPSPSERAIIARYSFRTLGTVLL